MGLGVEGGGVERVGGEVRDEKTDEKENRYFYFRKAQILSLKETSEVMFTAELTSWRIIMRKENRIGKLYPRNYCLFCL